MMGVPAALPVPFTNQACRRQFQRFALCAYSPVQIDISAANESVRERIALADLWMANKAMHENLAS